jgi:NAD-dependent SIR2 family protein deacetylase
MGVWDDPCAAELKNHKLKKAIGESKTEIKRSQEDVQQNYDQFSDRAGENVKTIAQLQGQIVYLKAEIRDL